MFEMMVFPICSRVAVLRRKSSSLKSFVVSILGRFFSLFRYW
jgi:hypothetical protein